MLFLVAWRSFVRLCTENRYYFVISFFCLISIFVSFLFLQGRAITSFTAAEEINPLSNVLYFDCDDRATAMEVYSHLMHNSTSYRIKSVTFSNTETEGVDWNLQDVPSAWYTPYGRFFTESEIKEGRNAVLLSSDYLKSLSPSSDFDDLWDHGLPMK